MTRQELAAARREDLREFKEQYKEARREFMIRDEFVPARLLGVTGSVLAELKRFGLIDQKGDGFAPAAPKSLQNNGKGRFAAVRRKN